MKWGEVKGTRRSFGGLGWFAGGAKDWGGYAKGVGGVDGR